MGSAQRRVINGEKGFYAKDWKGWGKSRGGREAVPKQLSESQVCEMVKLKLAHRYWGPRKIRTLYHRCHGQAPSESSFKRILEQVGLTQPRRVREGPREGGRLSSGRRGQSPNEVWTVDFKGWWRWGEGSRCEPLTIRDEFSRYVLGLRAMDNARTQTVREAFEGIFERHGLPEAIRSDNGAPFASVQALHGLSRLSAWWVALGLGIDLERGRPAHPQDNGGHERLHRDIAAELECLGQGARPEALELWREQFNRERPHEALEMRCPVELYCDSTRRYSGAEVQLSYPGMATRLVNKNGKFSWKQQRYSSVEAWRAGRWAFRGQKKANWKSGLAACSWDTSTRWTPVSCGPKSLSQSFFAMEISKREANACQSQKDKRWALEPIGFNWRLTHNRLYPGWSAAAT